MKTIIKLYRKKRHLKEKPYLENHFWARGYLIGMYKEKIKRYLEHPEEIEKMAEEEKGYNLI